MNKKQLIAFETRIAKLWQAGKIKVPVHLSSGNEDALIEIFKGIRKQDYVFSTHRNHFHYLLKTGNTKGLRDEILGKSRGLCHGKSGSMHTIDSRNRFYSSGIVAGCVSIAVGVAGSLKRKKSKQRVFCFIGDGAQDEGWFWEAWRYAVGHSLPITFIVEDNDRSVCTDKKTRWGYIPTDLIPSRKIIRYFYTPKFPHVGTGEDIQW